MGSFEHGQIANGLFVLTKILKFIKKNITTQIRLAKKNISYWTELPLIIFLSNETEHKAMLSEFYLCFTVRRKLIH